MVTGFRIGLSGAQGFFGVDPDLTVFGKIIAGGYPGAGGVGGHADCMAHLGAGLDASGKKVPKAMCGGTMAATPLSCAAGYYTLCEIERTNACEAAGRMGDRLTAGLQALIEKYGLPFVASPSWPVLQGAATRQHPVKPGEHVVDHLLRVGRAGVQPGPGQGDDALGHVGGPHVLHLLLA